MSAVELAALIREKKASPVEVMDAVLAQVEKHEPKLNAFFLLLADQAREKAKAAEAAVASGAELGPLHGVPVTIKDLAPLKGLPMGSGSHTTGSPVQSEDTPLATRLVEAGAIIIGKTTTPEFGWTGVSRSPLTGLTHNPWKHGYNAGASSAGAGVAAAAGFGPLHQGSDGAGSVRMPAHFCGVYGLKPSHGRVPYYPMSLGDFTSHNGPLTRTVADAALMTRVMAGPHPWDHSTLESPPADYPARLHEPPARRWRIAYSPDLGHARVDPEVAALVRIAAEGFAAAAKAELVEVSPVWGPAGPELGRFFWSANLSRLKGILPEWRGKMDPGLVACIEESQDVTVSEYQRQRARKYDYIREINGLFKEFDFLVTPAVSVAAFPLPRLMPEHWPEHEWDWLSWAEFSYPFNMSGNPAASLPCGFTAEGLPVGMQIVGPRFDDLGVLQASAIFEKTHPWADKRPPLG
ncbi:amidase [Acetobacteraceae bacterium H6797]|nr:amidase [Acetobacteraceae bacterium H6797]